MRVFNLVAIASIIALTFVSVSLAAPAGAPQNDAVADASGDGLPRVP